MGAQVPALKSRLLLCFDDDVNEHESFHYYTVCNYPRKSQVFGGVKCVCLLEVVIVRNPAVVFLH